MAEKPITPTKSLRKDDIAKPLHLQRLEAALDLRPFMSFMDKVFEKDESAKEDSSSEDSQISEDDLSQGDKIMHGVVTTKDGEDFRPFILFHRHQLLVFSNLLKICVSTATTIPKVRSLKAHRDLSEYYLSGIIQGFESKLN